MAYAIDAKLAARNYSDQYEQRAFKLGYANGYNGFERESRSWLVSLCPNAYSAGYWEGFSDAGRVMPQQEKK